MNEYLLLIHDTAPAGRAIQEDWDNFFDAARDSTIFRGGSEVGESEIIGDAQPEKLSQHIAGYMRFDAEEREQVLALLKLHPTVLHGGTVELCELPKS